MHVPKRRSRPIALSCLKLKSFRPKKFKWSRNGMKGELARTFRDYCQGPGELKVRRPRKMSSPRFSRRAICSDMVERGSGQNKKNGLSGEGITISAKVLGHCGCAGWASFVHHLIPIRLIINALVESSTLSHRKISDEPRVAAPITHSPGDCVSKEPYQQLSLGTVRARTHIPEDSMQGSWGEPSPSTIDWVY